MTYQELVDFLKQREVSFNNMQPVVGSAPSLNEIISSIQSQYQAPQFQQVQNFASGAQRFIDPNAVYTQQEFTPVMSAPPSFVPGAFDIERYRYKDPSTMSEVIDAISSGAGGDSTSSISGISSSNSGFSVSPSQAASIASAVVNGNPVALAIALGNIAMSNSGGDSASASSSDASNATGIAGIGASDAAAATGSSSSVGDGAVGGSVGDGSGAVSAGDGGVGGGDGSGGGGGGGGSGGCFLTTATVKYMDHEDDGDVLTTLRKFRDEYMRKDNEALKDVVWYYENAPKIVAAIDARPDAKKIYKKMFNEYIMPSVLAIKTGKNDVAYEIYKNVVDFARHESGISEQEIKPRFGKFDTTNANIKKHFGNSLG